MAQFVSLFLVTNEKRFVVSVTNQAPYVLPALNTEDGIPIQLSALKRISTSPSNPFERISLQGFSLFVSVGTAGTVLASQNVWSISSDGYSLAGTVDLNTVGINALADGASVTFEARLSDGGPPWRVQQTVTIKKSVALSTAIVTPVTEAALGVLQAQRTYMRKEGLPGEGYILTSADGLKQEFNYLHNDGSHRAELIS